MSIQEILWIAGLVSFTVAGLDWLIRLWFEHRAKARDRVPAELAATINQLNQQLRDAAEEKQKVIDQRDESQRRATTVEGERVLAAAKLDAAQHRIGQLEAELSRMRPILEQTQVGHAELERQRRSLDRRVRAALALGGEIWTQETMNGTATFRALRAREVPIVSVLNLKGGVGKTTLTAYLAWGLARRNYRVLLVDLDLQGSLSSLFLSQTAVAQREGTGQNLRHFLEAVSRHPRTSLLEYIHGPILGNQSALVATTDRHAYSEMNLTFQWLLRMGHPHHQWDGRRDTRFLLRRGLHARPIARRFDVILLDCPPIINLGCVNALAASDYVLIPATCSRKATERVPPLIRRVRELRDTLNNNLEILGLVASRTRGADGLNAPEQQLWNLMIRHASDELRVPVNPFNQTFPDRTQIRDAEDCFTPPPEGSDLSQAVTALAAEFERRLPSDSRRPAKTPAQSQ
jgi:cellulose biosynthesis protein BcsQ